MSDTAIHVSLFIKKNLMHSVIVLSKLGEHFALLTQSDETVGH